MRRFALLTLFVFALVPFAAAAEASCHVSAPCPMMTVRASHPCDDAAPATMAACCAASRSGTLPATRSDEATRTERAPETLPADLSAIYAAGARISAAHGPAASPPSLSPPPLYRTHSSLRI